MSRDKETKEILEEYREMSTLAAGHRAKAELDRHLSMKEMLSGVNDLLVNDVDKLKDSVRKKIDSLKYTFPAIAPDCMDLLITKDETVLINGASGRGKSTVARNIVMAFIEAGLCEDKKFLYIANEESSAVVLWRLACLRMGMNPSKVVERKEMTPSEQAQIDKEIEFLMDRVVIVANDSSKSEYSAPQVAEGINAILEKAYGKYCGVVIDYYQAITSTTAKPNAEPFEAQGRFVQFLDTHRTKMEAPIFIMAQSKPLTSHESRSEFQRIRQIGRTSIYEKCTIVLEIQKVARKPSKNNTEAIAEMAAAGELFATAVYIHKSREQGIDGQALIYKFEHGRYAYVRLLTRDQTENLP